MDNPDGVTNSDASDAYDYYLSIGDRELQSGFRCLDDPSNLAECMSAVQSTTTDNFVVDFSDDTAWGAFDLPTRSISALLDEDRPETISTRWVNIWYPYQHRSLLELLAKRYDFSPRLLALMCSDPRLRRSTPSRTSLHKPSRKRFWERASVSIADTEADTELSDEISEHWSISSGDSVARSNLYSIADNIWHYSSVDFGRQYVCIGYNSLYGTKQGSHAGGEDTIKTVLPHCTRVWTWLVLCEDNTVISINEDPFPFTSSHHFSALQCRILSEIRRNLVNVFRSLSSVHDTPLLSRNPMTILPIRTRLGNTPEETAHRSSDAPGLLFYYLFENWHNSYTLVTRKESRYGVELTNLREDMFSLPKLVHIDRLDSLGKELGVLKRHYESHDRIIDRLLEPQHASAASLQNSQVGVGSSASQVSVDTVRPAVLVTESQSLMGVSLSSAARVRFRRLKDMIDLYALQEVEEYIKQKEALVAMNFSLIAIKQSLDVDKLTRITLLLTKATFLFLPTSLMTSYFSTQLIGVAYSVQTYWITFAVMLALSWMGLFMFGVSSGNVQTMEVMRGIGRGVRTLFKKAVGKG
ncbi:hypothetical protein AC579_9000 [Lecanosticta acicola]|uniref:ADP-ribosylation factor n=1 Tax=Lecanosticta acicola TaxID=111012 RepID=A0AAI9E9U6_9PEZI|nr:hypothetical protein AC579_9000 [Lecanosticta acicola]